jgi:DNA-binding MarR family transcriptional regulator
MAKRPKKKSKNGFDLGKWNKRELKELQEGKYMGQTKYRYNIGAEIGGKPYPMTKIRYRKFYVPKWIHKIKSDWLQSEYIEYFEKNGRFPNNEERILARIKPFSDNKIKNIANDTVIDYKNISRYLNKMEKKGLIKTKTDYRYKRQKSGRLKKYHHKEINITKKGRDLHKKLFGRNY